MRIAVSISILLSCLGCSSKQSENKANYKAIILHNSMMQKADQIVQRLEALKADTTVNKDSVMVLSNVLEQWQADVVEVPGNDEHDHDHNDHDHHDHAHSHNPPPDVTEEQMLEIQRELDERLSVIGKRMARLKEESHRGESN